MRIFTSWNRIGHCRNPLLLSPIFQDHSLLAHEAGHWSWFRQQPSQKSRVTKKNNCLWLSADHGNIAKFKETCWHVFVDRYSGGCQNVSNNFKQLSDVSCMNTAMGTIIQETGSPDYWRPSLMWLKFAQKCNALLLNFWTEMISFLSWWGWLGPQDRSMPTSKDTKDLYVEKKRGRVASGMQYQGQQRRDCRMYGQVHGCHFLWQRCDWMFSIWREYKWRIVFAVCQGQVFPFFSARG